MKDAANASVEFSKYNEISLTIPQAADTNAEIKEKFIAGMQNSINAQNFHAEWTMDNVLYSSDIIAGQRAFTSASMTAQGTTIPVLQVYREWSDGTLDLWQRRLDMEHMTSPTDSPVWLSWSKTSQPEAEEDLKTDFFLQNSAYIVTSGGRDPEVLYLFAKYDAASDTYILRDFNIATMSVVEYNVKFAEGYMSEITIKNKDWLLSIGTQEDSITFTYSKYGTTTVEKPSSIS